MRKNGTIKPCEQCGKDVYVNAFRAARSKHTFCSIACHTAFQGRNKVKFVCKVCKSEFRVSKSEVIKSQVRGHKKQYCSLKCRDNDKTRMTEKAHIMNRIQLNKNGLNKLELAGRNWLENMGFVRNVDFFEQVLLFDRFTVDAFIPKYNLVVQFDGEYWHKKPKRVKLDISQDAYLTKCGMTVYRITDKEMKSKDFELFQKKQVDFLVKLNPVLSNVKFSFHGYLPNH